MPKLLLILIVLFLPFSSAAKEVLLRKDTKINVEYMSAKTSDKGVTIMLQAKDNVFQNGDLLIPRGAIGEVEVTKIGGLRKDKAKDIEGYIEAIDGETIPLAFEKEKGKKLRKTFNAVRLGSIVFNPLLGAGLTVMERSILHELNESGLPRKYYSADDIFVEI